MQYKMPENEFEVGKDGKCPCCGVKTVLRLGCHDCWNDFYNSCNNLFDKYPILKFWDAWVHKQLMLKSAQMWQK